MDTPNLAVQVVLAIVMLAVTVGIGLASARSKKFNNVRIATVGNCFSAGILLSIALIQLIPEGVADIDQQVDSGFALGNVLTVVGFMLILVLEKVVFFGQVHGPVRKDLLQQQVAQPDEDLSSSEMFAEVPATEEIRVKPPTAEPLTAAEKRTKFFRGLYLSVALSIHGLLEGVAIGIQGSVKSTAGIGLAVFVHKFPAALALGINTCAMHKIESTVLITAFSLASFLGVFIGIGFQTLGDPLTNGVFLALCAGSFLYISTTELIAEEFESSRDKWPKMFSFLIGFGLCTGLGQIAHE